MKSDSKNKEMCEGCDKCCRYIAIEIDKPTTKAEYQNIIWMLIHKDVSAYIGFDNHWYLEFQTPCLKLNAKGLCSDYDNRPDICREYDQEECPKYSKGSAEKVSFRSAEDFKKYLKSKGKSWERKK